MPDQPWHADHVERRATHTLTPSAGNARQHTDVQMAELVRSIETWGWTIPILIGSTSRARSSLAVAA